MNAAEQARYDAKMAADRAYAEAYAKADEDYRNATEVSIAPPEVAIHLIGEGWVRRTFKTKAAEARWFTQHAGEYDEVRWAR